MEIIYWSDYACPYCYIGEARLRKAVERLGMSDMVKFVPRAFELDPGASATVQSDTATRFATKYHLSLAEAEAQIEHISRLGRDEGIDFRYATTRYTNTFNAHRLMKMALSTGDVILAEKTNNLLFDAYFTKNLELAADQTLFAVAQLAGLEEAAVKEMLASDRFAAQVREDEQDAASRGVRGVPYFIFPGGFSVPGALSLGDFMEALRQAKANEEYAGSISGSQCGSDGCALN